MLDYLKNYKAKNPRALRLGLMTTGLSLMKGAGQTYETPVSTVGLMGEAGLQGLGAYETARAQDISSKRKALEEKGRERRYTEGITARKDISETEIGARESTAEYKTGKAAEISKADIAARKSLAEYKAGQTKRLTELKFGPESLKAKELGLRYGKGGIEEQKLEALARKGLSPSVQLSQQKLDAWKAYNEGTATPEQKELIKAGPRHTAKDVVDFFNSLGGDYEILSETEKAVIESMLPGTGLGIIEEPVPAEKSWWGDIGEKNIKATTRKRLGMLPTEQKTRIGLMPRETEEPKAKKWGIVEVKEILKKAGMSQTDKNIEQFMKMNPR